MSRIVIKGGSLDEIVIEATDEIRHQMDARAHRAANELRNSALTVLRGQRSGRRYRVPGMGTYYTASAPGEPPAARTSAFRLKWEPRAYSTGDTYYSVIENDKSYADYLENGTPGGQMAPRPHHDRIRQAAEPAIRRIYEEPYFNE